MILQDRLMNKHKSSKNLSQTPDRPHEGNGGDSNHHHALSPQRRGSFSGLNGLAATGPG